MMFSDSSGTGENQLTIKESIEKLKPTPHLLLVIFFTLGLIGASIFINLAITRWRGHVYEYKITSDRLTMKDGVELSVSLVIPVQRIVGEKFSILLDYSIGRKDDVSYIEDYRYFAALASSGYAIARVDVRGTGSSQGKLQDRISSEQELEDGLEVIHQLSKKYWCTGKVVLIGMSSNMLLLAARQPPALKSVFMLHTPHDLYWNSIHHKDGSFQANTAVLNMAHQHALPQSTHYALNNEYFEQRFLSEPWMMRYLEHSLDGPFWSVNSVQESLKNIRVPVYLVGGLYDSYVDSALRIYEQLKNYVSKVKVVIGPFNRAWPSEAKPGPNFDGREEAVKWLNKWLKNRHYDEESNHDVSVYIRDSHTPDTDTHIPGVWTYTHWPIDPSLLQQHQFYMSSRSKLTSKLSEASAPSNESLPYNPTIGAISGMWWGDFTPNMDKMDDSCLIYESETIASPITIVGFPSVSLRVATNTSFARWIVRLEEVHPDGQVSLVSTGSTNSALREGRMNPVPTSTNEYVTLKFDLHFTTWRFATGNKVRVAISNSLWPTFWPTPHQMTSYISLDDRDTMISLPALAPSFRIVTPSFTKIAPQTFYPFVTKSLQRKDAFHYDFGKAPRNYGICNTNTTRSLIWTSDTYSNIKGTLFANFVAEHYWASIQSPGDSIWAATARTLYVFDFGTPEDVSGATNMYVQGNCDDSDAYDWNWMPQVSGLNNKKRTVDLRTEVTLQSNATHFNLKINRVLRENNQLVKEYSQSRQIARQYQ